MQCQQSKLGAICDDSHVIILTHGAVWIVKTSSHLRDANCADVLAVGRGATARPESTRQYAAYPFYADSCS